MKETSFNDHWLFYREGGAPVPVTLPHDAMLLEPREAGNPSGVGCAFFAGGRYVYEKTFTLQDCESAALRFEGIYPTGEIYLDGEKTAECKYGFNDCYVDLSPLTDGKEHRIRVIADNTGVPNSRWYSGAGLYRPVWLFTGPAAHILPDGIRISTLSYSPVRIRVRTAHTGDAVLVEILDGDKVIARAESEDAVLAIPDAKLWSAEHPDLYTCRVTAGGDTAECRFGIRMLETDENGLHINGETVKLKGGCIHHDNGVIGARTYESSEYRRVKKLKAFGYNAIRSAHNPISRSLLKACDELGMYIMDEGWDMWYEHKNPEDYASRFEDNWQQDLKSITAKDFNHPSVVLYSIGNEVTEPGEEKGVALARQMTAYLHELDDSRPVTAGINPTLIMMRKVGIAATGPANEPEPDHPVNSTDFNKQISEMGKRLMLGSGREDVDQLCSPVLDTLDVAGYNYATPCYELDGVRHPGRLLVGSETFPQDLPVNWPLVEKLPYLLGDFMWTAWDYIGEVGVGAWSYHADGRGFSKQFPWLLADTGAFDILGDDNAEAGLAAVIWGARKTPYLAVQPVNQDAENLYKAMWRGSNAIPSWSWRGCEGRNAEVEVYSDAYEIELLLNGKSFGRRAVSEGFLAEFTIPYEPGVLTAIAYDKEGLCTGESSLTSAEGDLSVRILPEEETVIGRPLYIDLDIVGTNNIVESNADRTLTVQLEGAELVGFGSANPRTQERFESGSYTTYYGRSLLVIIPRQETVKVIVTTSDAERYEMTL